MASSPPVICLRGGIQINAAAAATLSTALIVPVAIYLYDSVIGYKPELSYQKLDGSWVEISKPSTTPGITEADPIFDGEVQLACDRINQVGMKMWLAEKLQGWANGNLFAFFKDMVGSSPVPGAGPVTPVNFLDRVNAGLSSEMVLLDTNGDGVPEFHGK